MTPADAILQRVREEMIRRAAELNDPTLTSITVVVKMDGRTHQPGVLLWRPEHERKLRAE